MRIIDVSSPKHTISGAHAASYSMGNWVLSAGANREVCEASYSPSLHLVPKLRKVELYFLSHICLHGVHKKIMMYTSNLFQKYLLMALLIATRISLRMVECIVHISNCFSCYPF